MMSPLDEQALDRRIGELPPLSSTAMEIIALLEAPQFEYAQLERLIGREPALAGRLLRLANSAFFGYAGRIGTLREACLIVGGRALRQMILAVAVMQHLTVEGLLLQPDRLWQHALATAAIARRLAPLKQLDADLAFTAGLLHDVGTLALAAFFAKEYRPVLTRWRDERCALEDAEQQQLGFSHGLVGEKLARKWHLPEALVAVIGRHHAPQAGAPSALVDLVHLADVLAHGLEYGLGEEDQVPAIDPEAWRRLGLEWEQLAELLQSLDEDARDAANIQL